MNLESILRPRLRSTVREVLKNSRYSSGKIQNNWIGWQDVGKTICVGANSLGFIKAYIVPSLALMIDPKYLKRHSGNS